MKYYFCGLFILTGTPSEVVMLVKNQAGNLLPLSPLITPGVITSIILHTAEGVVCKVKNYYNMCALCNLVPFVQFIKREKHPWRSVAFSKVSGFSLLKVTLLHRCFRFFKIVEMVPNRENRRHSSLFL